MPALTLMVTTAGLDALVDAQTAVTDPIAITEIGLTDDAFVMAPTLTALPGEFKRIDAVAGQSASATIIHMVAQDDSTDIYTARGLGLFLADGTLFAVYSQADAIVSKVSIASFLIAVDVAFLDAVESAVEFGDSLFLYPPATEITKGVAFLATDAKADAGVDHQSIMTPYQVKRLLDVLRARTITGGGLVTGGGDLTGNRVLTVTAAGADVSNPAIANKAVTPQDLWSFIGSAGGTGLFQIPGTKYVIMFATGTVAANSSTTVTLPGTFATACAFAAMAGGRNDTAAEENDPFVQSWTSNSVTVFSAAGASVSFTIMAIGY